MKKRKNTGLPPRLRPDPPWTPFVEAALPPPEQLACIGHPSQILGQVPGTAAGVTNGEGHNTAIRQPFTTAPVYLFLEDGIPIRSTGFFNHNALYEINLPQAGGLEVNRGPTTALYGSDAIGGAVNVLTRMPPAATEFSLFGEAGSFGWKRILGSAGTTVGDAGLLVNANRTHTDGWRSKTAYDRESLTARWDHALDANTVVKTDRKSVV